MFKRISTLDKLCCTALFWFGSASAVSFTKHGIDFAGKIKKNKMDIAKPKKEETENFSSIFPI